MSFGRTDPGPCPVCGAAHTACTAEAGPIVIAQLPARDAAALEPSFTPLVADQVQATLPADHFTTGTYRRKKLGT